MNLYTKKQHFLLQKIIVSIVAVCLAIIGLNIFRNQVRNSFYSLSFPVSKTFWQAGNVASLWTRSFANIKTIREENIALKEENQKFISEISSLQSLLKENQALKEVTQNTAADTIAIVPAELIGLDSTNDTALINKGSGDGVLENMPVISSQKVLYGKIFKVYKNFSQIMLISSKSSVLDVKIQQDDPTQPLINGVVKGKGGLSCYLDLIPSDTEIKQGQVLTTSALEGVFPKDLPVGRIISINKNDLKPFQTAEIQPFFDMKNAENLFVITDYKKEK